MMPLSDDGAIRGACWSTEISHAPSLATTGTRRQPRGAPPSAIFRWRVSTPGFPLTYLLNALRTLLRSYTPGTQVVPGMLPSVPELGPLTMLEGEGGVQSLRS